jgi:aspartyl-tRNA(Asn)/glutamyl-tRNA(Gln) amidotransferase subunit B
MEEGSMRADVNISVRRPGAALGTRAEIKNVNSMKFMATAIEFETYRQISLLEAGGTVDQETRLFDADTGETVVMRSKEDAQDYRYFPEPDLPPLVLTEARIKKIRRTIPELPDAKARRLQLDLGLSHYDALLISSEIEIADYYEQALASANCSEKEFAKMLANWIIGELFAYLNKYGNDITESHISPENLAELVTLIKTDVISGKIAKDVLEIMWETWKSPSVVVEERGMKQITSVAIIEKCLREILAENNDKVIEYRNGKDKLFGFFIGQAMKRTEGKANPQILNDTLKNLLLN